MRSYILLGAALVSAVAAQSIPPGQVNGVCCPAKITKTNDQVKSQAGLGVKNPVLECGYKATGQYPDPTCSYAATEFRYTPNIFFRYARQVDNRPKLKPGEFAGGNEICDKPAPNTRQDGVPCALNFCCPTVYGSMEAIDSHFRISKFGREIFWCSYNNDKGCEYYADTGDITFTGAGGTPYRGFCPDKASTGKTCVFRGSEQR